MIKQTDLAGSFTVAWHIDDRKPHGLRRDATRWPDGNKLVWGPPRDIDAAIAVLREAVEAGVNHIDTSDYYGPHVTNQIIEAGASSLSRGSSDRHQSRRSPG